MALCLAAAPAAATAAPYPACAGAVEIADGHLLRVEKNGAIVLTDGRAVHLEGIRLAAGAQDRAPQEIADRALSAIRLLSGANALSFTAVPPKEDRYDRVRAQGFAGGKWLQGELLARGAGACRPRAGPRRVRHRALCGGGTRPWRSRRLWALPAYAIRTPENVARDAGTFQIVQGTVVSASRRDGRVVVDFGDGWRHGFTAVIAHDDVAAFKQIGVDPHAYAGQTIRVRGIVQMQDGGPVIEVFNPQSVEVVSSP